MIIKYVEELPLKSVSVSYLKKAGIERIEQLSDISDDKLAAILPDERLLLDVKECIYCISCRRSIFHAATCRHNVERSGRFVVIEKEGFHCPARINV